jgi:hypothetical protein
MTKPTDKQIKTEIAKLEKMKPRVRHYSGFGDDHHAAIDAQLEVLKDNLSDEEIEWRMDSDMTAEEELWKENQRDAALEARNWLEGEEKISPTKNWASLVS